MMPRFEMQRFEMRSTKSIPEAPRHGGIPHPTWRSLSPRPSLARARKLQKLLNNGRTPPKSPQSRVHHSSLRPSSSLPSRPATNDGHLRRRRRRSGLHGHRPRVRPPPLGIFLFLRAAAAAVAAVVLPGRVPARGGGEAARGAGGPGGGDGARGGEEERADREHQQRRARRHRVLFRQGAARGRARRHRAHRRGRGLRQDEEAALLAILGADERRREDGVGRPGGRGRGRRRRVVRRRARQQRQGPRRRQAGGGLGEVVRRGAVPVHQQRRHLQGHRRAAARRGGRGEGERRARGRGEVPRGAVQQLGVVPAAVHDRLRQQQGLRGVVLRQDRAEAAGAYTGERDAADQHHARPGPVEHAGAGRGEPRRGGGEDLQLRVGPRRDAGRHGEAVRGGRGRHRGDRPLRPRRRRRRRQEGLPLPQHAFLHGAPGGEGGAGVGERDEPAGGPQGAVRRVRRQRPRREGHDLRPRRQDPRRPREGAGHRRRIGKHKARPCSTRRPGEPFFFCKGATEQNEEQHVFSSKK